MAKFAVFPRWSLTSWLLCAGLFTLGFFLAVPAWTANRLARIETRAEETARELLAAARGWPTDPLAASAEQALLQEVRRRCQALGHPDSALLVQPEEMRGLRSASEAARFFASRHYLFQLTRTPVSAYGDGGITRVGPLEVLAWPRTALSGAKTAFFLPEEGRAVYSRNLAAGYLGRSRAPRPGQARPRVDMQAAGTLPEGKRDGWYRGFDDERWIELPAR